MTRFGADFRLGRSFNNSQFGGGGNRFINDYDQNYKNGGGSGEYSFANNSNYRNYHYNKDNQKVFYF